MRRRSTRLLFVALGALSAFGWVTPAHAWTCEFVEGVDTRPACAAAAKVVCLVIADDGERCID